MNEVNIFNSFIIVNVLHHVLFTFNQARAYINNHLNISLSNLKPLSQADKKVNFKITKKFFLFKKKFFSRALEGCKDRKLGEKR